jgi:hypothetical protein
MSKSIAPSAVPTRAQARRGLRAIEAGQVVCPRRGILDIETCWTCRDFGGQATDGETLVCRWSRLWTLTSRSAPTQARERRP